MTLVSFFPCLHAAFEPLTDEARLEMVKDYQGLNDAKKEVTRSYEYSGTEKLQKCQELGEVRMCTCTSTVAQRRYRCVNSCIFCDVHVLVHHFTFTKK